MLANTSQTGERVASFVRACVRACGGVASPSELFQVLFQESLKKVLEDSDRGEFSNELFEVSSHPLSATSLPASADFIDM